MCYSEFCWHCNLFPHILRNDYVAITCIASSNDILYPSILILVRDETKQFLLLHPSPSSLLGCHFYFLFLSVAIPIFDILVIVVHFTFYFILDVLICLNGSIFTYACSLPKTLQFHLVSLFFLYLSTFYIFVCQSLSSLIAVYFNAFRFSFANHCQSFTSPLNTPSSNILFYC